MLSSTNRIAEHASRSKVVAPSWLGKRVGRFKLISLLGQGSMGRVFCVEDTTLKRYAAMKVLPKTIRRGEKTIAVERLINEARAAATLDHPNAVTVYEVNEAGGIYYIAMELLEGGNLRDMVKAAGAMEYSRACVLCAEAAEALAHAHAMGIVHRDVKPANLLLTRTGRCKVADFGLARVSEAGELTGALPESVGTPQFIAPEILRGIPASAQSDIYSLGATLWYLLTGRPVFEGHSSADLVHHHLHTPPPDLSRLRPDLPDGLVGAVERAMAKDPAERFASAEEFALVLRAHTIPSGSRDTLPVASVSTQGAGGARRGRPPGRLVMAGVAGVILLLGAALVPAWKHMGGQRATDAATAPAPKPAPIVAGPAAAPPVIAQPKAIDLMPMIDPATATVSGRWKMDGGSLFSDNSVCARLEIPYRPPHQYDFVVEFTTAGGIVEQQLARGATAFTWCMNVRDLCGFESVRQTHVWDSPARVRLPMAPETRHTSLVQVRDDGVKAFIDGKLVCQWKTDFRDFSREQDWFLRDNTRLGLGTSDKWAAFHRISVTEYAEGWVAGTQ